MPIDRNTKKGKLLPKRRKIAEPKQLSCPMFLVGLYLPMAGIWQSSVMKQAEAISKECPITARVGATKSSRRVAPRDAI